MLLLGGPLATARTLRAQQKTMPVIGYLSLASPAPNAANVAAFRQGLHDTGYVEGQNVVIEYRWAEGHFDRLPALAADLVGRKPDVIMTSGGTAPAQAAKKRDLDHPDRLHRWRPGRGRIGCQPRPAGRQSHGHDIHDDRASA
jgi:ABC-type uncharacterized transport system substrate-binding protein